MTRKENCLVVVGSLNEAKVEATREAVAKLESLLGRVDVEAVEVPGIAQPFDGELYTGSIARACKALSHGKVQGSRRSFSRLFGVGIEGGLVKYHGGHYITAYCHVVDEKGEEHGSWTAFLEVPAELHDSIRDGGLELGGVIGETRERQGWPWRGGAFGTLTAGQYTRKEAIADALILAFSPFFLKP